MGRVTEFIGAAQKTGAALLVFGDAGVGKSVLLDAAAEIALGAGFCVLRTSGVEFEADLSYSGLNHIFEPLREDLAKLRPSLRKPLSRALGLSTGSPPDRLVVCNAALALVREVPADVRDRRVRGRRRGAVAQPGHNQVMGMTMRLENWSNASDQGAAAARNAILPESASPYQTVPYYWSDWYGHRIQFVGSPICDSITFYRAGRSTETFVALYRAKDRLIGAATLNGPRMIMKYRRLISQNATVGQAVDLFAADLTEEAAIA